MTSKLALVAGVFRAAAARRNIARFLRNGHAGTRVAFLQRPVDAALKPLPKLLMTRAMRPAQLRAAPSTLAEPSFSSKRSSCMKRFVARCPATEIAVIVAVPESVLVPPDGTNVAIPCPCCHTVHVMRMRDAKDFRKAS
jgi:hypothetical protein